MTCDVIKLNRRLQYVVLVSIVKHPRRPHAKCTTSPAQVLIALEGFNDLCASHGLYEYSPLV